MTREELLIQAKPVLFNTEMVKAILEDRKTVTRRVVKPKHKGASGIKIMSGYVYDVIPIDFIDGQTHTKEYQRAPFHAGDYLYVRETWTDPTPDQSGYPILYMADMPMRWKEEGITLKAEDYKWKPSLHMPKEAARIFLKVNDVRVERLQDITEEQVLAEGTYPSNCRECTGKMGCDLCPDEGYYEIDAFQYLWNSTIKKADLDKYGWEASPWVWVIEFERVEVES